MKRILPLLASSLLLLSAGFAVAQNAKPPSQLTYQGFLTDGSGVPFGSTAPVNKTVIFRIYDALSGGTIKWSSQQVVTVDKGYFSALLGQGSAVGTEPFSSDLTGIFSGPTASDRFLELNADGTTIAPRLRFLPSPYAMLARSATELLDPVTGTSSLSIASGVISGNGASLINLNGANISAGTVADSRLATISTAGKVANSATTATSANTANAIIARDASGNFTAGAITAGTISGTTITASTFSGSGASLTSLNAGQIASGTLDNARTTATSAKTANAIVARDASGNITAGQVVADSFKIKDTQTLVLYSIVRSSMWGTSAITGVTQSTPSNGDNTTRQGGSPTDWWKSTQTAWGSKAYTATFTVPTGEVWEADYTCAYWWGTDDTGSLVWSMDDVATDDAVTTMNGLNQSSYTFNQTFILSAGTHTVNVKTIIANGSGGDHIYFPWHMPSHCVVKKYKSN